MKKPYLWILGAVLVIIIGFGIWWFFPRTGNISLLTEKQQTYGEEIIHASASNSGQSIDYAWEFREHGLIFIKRERSEGSTEAIITKVQYASISDANSVKLRDIKATASNSKFYICPDTTWKLSDNEVLAENGCLGSSPVMLRMGVCEISASCKDFFKLDAPAKDAGKSLQSLLFWKRMPRLK